MKLLEITIVDFDVIKQLLIRYFACDNKLFFRNDVLLQTEALSYSFVEFHFIIQI